MAKSDIETRLEAKKLEFEKHMQDHREFAEMARKQVGENQVKAIRLDAEVKMLESLLPKKK